MAPGTGQSGGPTQLRGVPVGVAQRLHTVLGDELVQVRGEAAEHLLALGRGQVEQSLLDLRQEVGDLGSQVGGGLAHAGAPSRMLVTVVAKCCQSSRCHFSASRPAGVRP